MLVKNADVKKPEEIQKKTIAADQTSDKYKEDILQNIYEVTKKLNDTLHKKYSKGDWTEIQSVISNKLDMANELCKEYTKKDSSGKDAFDRNREKYNEIDDRWKEVKRHQQEVEKESSTENINDLEDAIKDLFSRYNELNYSINTVLRQFKKNRDKETSDMESSPEIGMILLCKNVRIMEDLINKICTNNIDKSIIGGEKHFQSMRYGFEWLFCHNDINNNTDYNRIDIRDQNRYLDYIKCQMLIANIYTSQSPKLSTEIDKEFELFQNTFNKYQYTEKAKMIEGFRKKFIDLIGDFFKIYELLIGYRDALFREEEIRKSAGIDESPHAPEDGGYINENIIMLSSVALKVLLERFVSFVKISDLNFGNSMIENAWFNYSELSKSNYAGSNFFKTRLENAKVRDCDLSTCDFSLSDGGCTDFSGTNFNYSNLTGMNLIDAVVNRCEFQNSIFRDRNVDGYKTAYKMGREGYEKSREGREVAKILDIWTSSENYSGRIEEYIGIYNDVEIVDLDVRSDKTSWKILQFDINEDFKVRAEQLATAVLKSRLTEHIPALLMARSASFFSKRRQRIKDIEQSYGRVRWEVAELESITAKNAMFNGSDFCHVNMNNASFENSDLSGAVLYYTRARYSAFILCNLNQTNSFESDYYASNFSNALLNNSQFVNCNLSHTNWREAILINSVFADLSSDRQQILDNRKDEPYLKLAKYIGFDRESFSKVLDEQNYSATTVSMNQEESWQSDCGINDSNMVNVLADSTIFVNITADRSSFNGSSFKNAFFANCRMYLSDFIATDFRYASFQFCCLGQSSFHGANLNSVVLKYVDFGNSDLSESTLNLSEINHVLFSDADLRKMNVSGARIRNSAFVNSNISGMIFTNAVFENCIFSFIKFRDVVAVHSAKFINCYVYNCSYENKNREDQILNEETFFDVNNEGE